MHADGTGPIQIWLLAVGLLLHLPLLHTLPHKTNKRKKTRSGDCAKRSETSWRAERAARTRSTAFDCWRCFVVPRASVLAERAERSCVITRNHRWLKGMDIAEHTHNITATQRKGIGIEHPAGLEFRRRQPSTADLQSEAQITRKSASRPRTPRALITTIFVLSAIATCRCARARGQKAFGRSTHVRMCVRTSYTASLWESVRPTVHVMAEQDGECM